MEKNTKGKYDSKIDLWIEKNKYKVNFFLKGVFYIVDLILISILPIAFLSVFFIDDSVGWKMIDFLKSSSIPLIVLIIILTFKTNLAKFIDELKHLKVFGNEAIREADTESQSENPDVDKISEKVEKENNTNQDGDSELEKTKKYLEFERIYNLIFGSQIELLDTMKLNRDGLNMNFLQLFFYNIQNKFKMALDTWTLSGYLRFLEINKLVLFDNRSNNCSITDKGIEFLNYIELLGYLKNKNL